MPTTRTRIDTKSRPLLVGSLDVNNVLAFVFGVIFISVMLIFALLVPNPSPFATWVFTVVVALSGSGIGAVIPGILKIDLPFAKAGGALAIFAAVFFLKPQILNSVVQLEPPNESPIPVIDDFLALVDAKNLNAAWQSLDEASKQTIARDRSLHKEAYDNGRYNLGDVASRVRMGGTEATSPSGAPIGIYRGITYKTKFTSGLCYQENVVVRGTTDLKWRVFGHTINPYPIPC